MLPRSRLMICANGVKSDFHARKWPGSEPAATLDGSRHARICARNVRRTEPSQSVVGILRFGVRISVWCGIGSRCAQRAVGSWVTGCGPTPTSIALRSGPRVAGSHYRLQRYRRPLWPGWGLIICSALDDYSQHLMIICEPSYFVFPK